MQHAKSNGKLFRMNHLMGNSNHTLIIINAGDGHIKFNSDKSKEEMENRPRLVMNNDVLDIRRPNFGVDIIFTPENYTPTAPIPEGARAWVVVNIQDPFLCRYLEGHPRYTATYRERGIHMWCGPHGRSMDVYIGLDLSLMAEVHRAVRAAIQLRDTLATIGQEARHQGYANLSQPQRMEAITAIMQER